MELNEKLQELRKQKGLTQEELASVLFISRTAISKWESGKGYPNIESLKAISKFFGVSIDELLSGDELLTLAEEDSKQKKQQLIDPIFGLLDCGIGMFFFLPFFRQVADRTIQSISLLALTEVPLYLKIFYFTVVIALTAAGIFTLALQNCTHTFWVKYKYRISLICSTAGVFLFIISQQPYAAAFTFLFLIIKALMLIKKH